MMLVYALGWYGGFSLGSKELSGTSKMIPQANLYLHGMDCAPWSENHRYKVLHINR